MLNPFVTKTHNLVNTTESTYFLLYLTVSNVSNVHRRIILLLLDVIHGHTKDTKNANEQCF